VRERESAWVKNIIFKNKRTIILYCVLFYTEASNQLIRRSLAIFSTSGSCEKTKERVDHLLKCQLNYEFVKKV